MPRCVRHAAVTAESHAEQPTTTGKGRRAASWLAVAFLVYILICAVGLIGGGFKSATGGQAKELFAFATNPFLGLIIGTVATALIQSSSTVTSIIVALVAGGLPVAVAVPIVMGANVGTSITNTIVSLGYVRSNDEFRRAFEAATIHDYFNLLAVALFLPLEVAFGLLERVARVIAEALAGGGQVDVGSANIVKLVTSPVVDTLRGAATGLQQPYGGLLLVIVGVGLIFGAILVVGKLLRSLLVGRAKQLLHTAIGRGPLTGILSGTLVTVLVQSSSTTTSLMVPLAGAGIFTARQIYPFTLGANIGTCVTALLAATGVTGANAAVALQIALIHLLFNTSAVIVIWNISFLRELPLRAAAWLAEIASQRKVIALAYILGVFFVVPGLLLALSRML